MSVVTAPTSEPLDLARAKDHLRVTDSESDSLIASLIASARAYAEFDTQRVLVVQTRDLTLDAFPSAGVPIDLWLGVPLVSVLSVKYVDTDGNTQTLATSVYTVDAASTPGRVFLAFDQSWPDTRAERNAVTIQYVAGYVTPFSVAVAANTLTQSGRSVANGDVVRLSNSGGQLPAPLVPLTDYYVVGLAAPTFQLSLTSGGAAIDIADTGDGTHFLGVLPEDLEIGMLLLVGGMFENREEVAEGRVAPLPEVISARRLFAHHRVARFV